MNLTRFADSPEHYRLGEASEPASLATSEDNRTAALALATQAQHSLHIFTRDLDAPVYDQTSFLDAVTKLATRSRFSRIYVLLQNSDRVVKDGHRIVELSRRLSSYVEIRKPHRDYQNYNQAFLIADETGVLMRTIADRYEGTVNFNARREARELVHFFNEVWERSSADPDLRRVHI